MQTLQIQKFQCEKCRESYSREEDALQCESRPISQDKGIKIGDIVKITSGEGAGERLQVENVFVISKDWGHYRWERYWHTIGITGRVLNSWGSRMLTYDSYEVIR